MKKLLLATAATIGLTGVASAADLAVYAPVVVAPVDWTGLYVGANIGGGLVNETIDDKVAALTLSAENFRKGAFAAGVTAGYNWQFARHGLLGIEGDFNWTNFKASQFDQYSALDAKWSWFSTVRARAGIVNDRALFYLTGGVAFVDLKANGDNTGEFSCTINENGRCFHVSSTETGLAAGLGAEYAFGGGWTGRLEYLYVGLPRVDAHEEGQNFSKFDSSRYGVTSDAHLVRFGLNYLFNAGAPVVPVAGVASAADWAVKAPVAVAPVDRWTGLYVGANIGGGLFSPAIDDTNGKLTTGSENFRKGGFTAGVTAGYNWQFASYGLLGIEGDFNWANFKASQSDSKSVLDAKWSRFSTIRARAGIVYDRALFYVTGGVAFVDQKANGDQTGSKSCTSDTYQYGRCFHVSSTETGLAAGVGAEYAFGGGWTGKLEYLYVGLPRVDIHEEGYESERDDSRYGLTSDAHLVRFGLNYLFNAGAPVAPVAGVASAADWAFKAPVAVAPVYSWTGLYVGANIGGGLFNPIIDAKQGYGDLNDSIGSFRKGAFMAGVTAGYNWQFASYGLLGIEGDFNWANFKASVSDSSSTLDAKWSWFSTIRARAGIVHDRALYYATGGVAFVDLKANGDVPGDESCTVQKESHCFHVSSTETGLAAGVGAEYAIGGGWTGKLEYLYVGLPRVEALDEGYDHSLSHRFAVTSDAHLVRVGLNYLFNAGGPVVVKY